MIKNFFNGLVFGVSLIIPGVSGGTLAIVLGFYDQLIEAVNHFTEDFRRYIKFLLPFGLGIVIGIVAFASLIQFLLSHYSFPAMMFFIGLIAGIVPSMYRKACEGMGLGDKHKFSDYLLVLTPIVLLIMMAHFSDSGAAVNPAETVLDVPFMLFIFVVGIVAAASLLIPGLSGSFILLLAGVYHLATYAVSSMRLLLTDITNVDLILDITRVLGPLGIGVIIGIFATARLIEKLIAHRAKAVFLVVMGLMAGSVYVLLADPILFYSGVNTLIVLIGLFSCAMGAALSYALGKKKI